ncbi:MAG: metal-sensitive transcriptional regulator [Bacilli bacterium]
MDYSQDVRNRVRRMEGQLRGVLRMMDEDKECRDVLTQMSAIRSAMDRTIGLIVAKNLETCIRTQIEKGENADEVIEEAISMLVKSR